ncbi:MAG: tRNA dihydrouridine(20/20a) synthase DusA [Beijerinckiaceae bacterium]
MRVLDLRFSVAPMMDWTDRHCRFFHRILSRRARLYTEMLTSAAVIHGRRDHLLGFDRSEHPLAVQLGGSDPDELAAAARICADYGYDEINLNIGCPSERVQSGTFGACLMREPALVAACVAAMKAAVSCPVTVKCRIGVDDQDPRETLFRFAEEIVEAGADALIVHARKAWLKGLSPKENRDVPPLDYALVRDLKTLYPRVPIVLNGGLASLAQMKAESEGLDGVMIGRAAYQEPALLMAVDRHFFGDEPPVATRVAAIEAFLPYVEARLAEGTPLAAMTRHILGLFNGLRGARSWRRYLATEAVKPGAETHVLHAALAFVRNAEMCQEAEAAV